jgi:hypothetical protein
VQIVNHLGAIRLFFGVLLLLRLGHISLIGRCPHSPSRVPSARNTVRG